MLRHLQHKIKTHHNDPDGRIFAWLTMMSSIGNSIFLTIFPIILLSKLKNESFVGYYYSFIAVIILLSSIASTLIFQKYSKIVITKITLIVTTCTLFGLTLVEAIWNIAGLDIPRSICVITFCVAMSLFVGDFAKNSQLAKAEGRFYMFNNIGFLIGPVIGGYAARYWGNRSIFILAGVFYVFTLIMFLYQHIYQKNPHFKHTVHDESIRQLFSNIKVYFKHPEFRKVFLVALGLNYWWGISITYFPIEITNLGFRENIVGWIVAATSIPLILLERWVGKFADRRGVRISILIGFALLAIMVICFPFLYSKPILVLIAFSVVNFGAAWIEPLQETYFFKVAKLSEREKLFGIYNAAQPLSSILSPLIGGVLYAIDGSRGLWVGTALILTLFFLSATRIGKKY